MRPGLLLVLATTMLGCATQAEPPEPFQDRYVFERVGVDPISELGHGLLSFPEEGAQLLSFFDDIRCDGALPLVVEMVGERTSRSAEGRFGMYVGDPARAEPCTAECVPLVALFARGGAPPISGPLYMEGLEGEAWFSAHVSLGSPAADTLPEFLKISFEVSSSTGKATQGRMTGRWSAPFLHRLPGQRAPLLFNPVPPTTPPVGEPVDPLMPPPQRRPQSALDLFVTLGNLQPDVDEDSDGLERFSDSDGDSRIDTCVDGDGSVFEDPDCATFPEMADSYEFVLLFKLRPVEACSPGP